MRVAVLVAPRIFTPLLLFLAAALITGCGIKFSSQQPGAEFFEDLDLKGERLTNRELTIELQVVNTYSVPVRIACYYEKPKDLSDDEKGIAFEERARLIGDRVLEPVPGQSKDNPTEQMLRFSFSVPEAGSYNAACLTPAAPENAIGVSFNVKNAADAAA